LETVKFVKPFLSVFFLSAGVLLAACAGPEKDELKDKLQDGTEKTPAADAVSITTAPPAADIVPGPPLPEPDVVMGYTATAVAALLGTPDYRRRDTPAEIWQYRGDGCILDLFLYGKKIAPQASARNKKSGGAEINTPRVTHMEFRKSGGAAISDRDCFHELLRERQAGRPGRPG